MVLDWREVDGKARRGVRISTKNIQITTVSLLAAVFLVVVVVVVASGGPSDDDNDKRWRAFVH